MKDLETIKKSIDANLILEIGFRTRVFDRHISFNIISSAFAIIDSSHLTFVSSRTQKVIYSGIVEFLEKLFDTKISFFCSEFDNRCEEVIVRFDMGFTSEQMLEFEMLVS